MTSSLNSQSRGQGYWTQEDPLTKSRLTYAPCAAGPRLDMLGKALKGYIHFTE